MFVWAKQKATDGRPQLQQEGWRGEEKAIKTLEGGRDKRKARIPWNSKAQGGAVPFSVGQKSEPQVVRILQARPGRGGKQQQQ